MKRLSEFEALSMWRLQESRPIKVQLSDIDGKEDVSLVNTNGHYEDTKAEDGEETFKTINITDKDVSNEGSGVAEQNITLEVTSMEAKQNDINDSFRRFFSSIGFRLTVKSGSADQPKTQTEEPSAPDNTGHPPTETGEEKVGLVELKEEEKSSDPTVSSTLIDVTSDDLRDNTDDQTPQRQVDAAAEAASSAVGEASHVQQDTKVDEEQQPTSPSSHEWEVLGSPMKKFFTTGIFSGLRKKKKTEDLDTMGIGGRERETSNVADEDRQKESGPVEEAAAQDKENVKTQEEKAMEPEIVSSLEKERVQASPLRRLFASPSLRRFAKKQQEKIPSEPGEHASDEQTSDERPKDEDSKETKVEENSAWASFKKLMTPKKTLKKPDEEPQTEQAQKLSDGDKLSDSSSEQSRKRKDSSVSWEAVLCGSGRRRSNRDSQEDLPGTNNSKSKNDSAADEQSEDAGASSLKQAEHSPDSEGGFTWNSFKRLITPKRKAREDEDAGSKSTGLMTQDELSVPAESDVQSARKARDEAATAESDEESETPAVIPLSEFQDDLIPAEEKTRVPVDENAAQRSDSPALDSEDPKVEDLAAVSEMKVILDEFTEAISKHPQLSDIPEESAVPETMAPPVEEEPAGDDTLAEDLTDITSDAITAPEPADFTLTDETEMMSAVSQLSESPKSGASTPVPAYYSLEETEKVLAQVVETISAATQMTPLSSEEVNVKHIVGSISNQSLATVFKDEPALLEIHRNSDTSNIQTGLNVEEMVGEKNVEATVELESLSGISKALYTEMTSEVAPEDLEQAEMAVDEVLVLQSEEVQIQHAGSKTQVEDSELMSEESGVEGASKEADEGEDLKVATVDELQIERSDLKETVVQTMEIFASTAEPVRDTEEVGHEEELLPLTDINKTHNEECHDQSTDSPVVVSGDGPHADSARGERQETPAEECSVSTEEHNVQIVKKENPLDDLSGDRQTDNESESQPLEDLKTQRTTEAESEAGKQKHPQESIYHDQELDQAKSEESCGPLSASKEIPLGATPQGEILEEDPALDDQVLVEESSGEPGELTTSGSEGFPTEATSEEPEGKQTDVSGDNMTQETQEVESSVETQETVSEVEVLSGDSLDMGKSPTETEAEKDGGKAESVPDQNVQKNRALEHWSRGTGEEDTGQVEDMAEHPPPSTLISPPQEPQAPQTKPVVDPEDAPCVEEVSSEETTPGPSEEAETDPVSDEKLLREETDEKDSDIEETPGMTAVESVVQRSGESEERFDCNSVQKEETREAATEPVDSVGLSSQDVVSEVIPVRGLIPGSEEAQPPVQHHTPELSDAMEAAEKVELELSQSEVTDTTQPRETEDTVDEEVEKELLLVETATATTLDTEQSNAESDERVTETEAVFLVEAQGNREAYVEPESPQVEPARKTCAGSEQRDVEVSGEGNVANTDQSEQHSSIQESTKEQSPVEKMDCASEDTEETDVSKDTKEKTEDPESVKCSFENVDTSQPDQPSEEDLSAPEDLSGKEAVRDPDVAPENESSEQCFTQITETVVRECPAQTVQAEDLRNQEMEAPKDEDTSPDSVNHQDILTHTSEDSVDLEDTNTAPAEKEDDLSKENVPPSILIRLEEPEAPQTKPVLDPEDTPSVEEVPSEETTPDPSEEAEKDPLSDEKLLREETDEKDSDIEETPDRMAVESVVQRSGESEERFDCNPVQKEETREAETEPVDSVGLNSQDVVSKVIPVRGLIPGSEEAQPPVQHHTPELSDAMEAAEKVELELSQSEVTDTTQPRETEDTVDEEVEKELLLVETAKATTLDTEQSNAESDERVTETEAVFLVEAQGNREAYVEPESPQVEPARKTSAGSEQREIEVSGEGDESNTDQSEQHSSIQESTKEQSPVEKMDCASEDTEETDVVSKDTKEKTEDPESVKCSIENVETSQPDQPSEEDLSAPEDLSGKEAVRDPDVAPENESSEQCFTQITETVVREAPAQTVQAEDLRDQEVETPKDEDTSPDSVNHQYILTHTSEDSGDLEDTNTAPAEKEDELSKGNVPPSILIRPEEPEAPQTKPVLDPEDTPSVEEVPSEETTPDPSEEAEKDPVSDEKLPREETDEKDFDIEETPDRMAVESVVQRSGESEERFDCNSVQHEETREAETEPVDSVGLTSQDVVSEVIPECGLIPGSEEAQPPVEGADGTSQHSGEETAEAGTGSGSRSEPTVDKGFSSERDVIQDLSLEDVHPELVPEDTSLTAMGCSSAESENLTVTLTHVQEENVSDGEQEASLDEEERSLGVLQRVVDEAAKEELVVDHGAAPWAKAAESEEQKEAAAEGPAHITECGGEEPRTVGPEENAAHIQPQNVAAAGPAAVCSDLDPPQTVEELMKDAEEEGVRGEEHREEPAGDTPEFSDAMEATEQVGLELSQSEGTGTTQDEDEEKVVTGGEHREEPAGDTPEISDAMEATEQVRLELSQSEGTGTIQLKEKEAIASESEEDTVKDQGDEEVEKELLLVETATATTLDMEQNNAQSDERVAETETAQGNRETDMEPESPQVEPARKTSAGSEQRDVEVSGEGDKSNTDQSEERSSIQESRKEQSPVENVDCASEDTEETDVVSEDTKEKTEDSESVKCSIENVDTPQHDQPSEEDLSALEDLRQKEAVRDPDVTPENESSLNPEQCFAQITETVVRECPAQTVQAEDLRDQEMEAPKDEDTSRDSVDHIDIQIHTSEDSVDLEDTNPAPAEKEDDLSKENLPPSILIRPEEPEAPQTEPVVDPEDTPSVEEVPTDKTTPGPSEEAEKDPVSDEKLLTEETYEKDSDIEETPDMTAVESVVQRSGDPEDKHHQEVLRRKTTMDAEQSYVETAESGPGAADVTDVFPEKATEEAVVEEREPQEDSESLKYCQIEDTPQPDQPSEEDLSAPEVLSAEEAVRDPDVTPKNDSSLNPEQCFAQITETVVRECPAQTVQAEDLRDQEVETPKDEDTSPDSVDHQDILTHTSEDSVDLEDTNTAPAEKQDDLSKENVPPSILIRPEEPEAPQTDSAVDPCVEEVPCEETTPGPSEEAEMAPVSDEKLLREETDEKELVPEDTSLTAESENLTVTLTQVPEENVSDGEQEASLDEEHSLGVLQRVVDEATVEELVVDHGAAPWAKVAESEEQKEAAAEGPAHITECGVEEPRTESPEENAAHIQPQNEEAPAGGPTAVCSDLDPPQTVEVLTKDAEEEGVRGEEQREEPAGDTPEFSDAMEAAEHVELELSQSEVTGTTQVEDEEEVVTGGEHREEQAPGLRAVDGTDSTEDAAKEVKEELSTGGIPEDQTPGTEATSEQEMRLATQETQDSLQVEHSWESGQLNVQVVERAVEEALQDEVLQDILKEETQIDDTKTYVVESEQRREAGRCGPVSEVAVDGPHEDQPPASAAAGECCVQTTQSVEEEKGQDRVPGTTVNKEILAASGDQIHLPEASEDSDVRSKEHSVAEETGKSREIPAGDAVEERGHTTGSKSDEPAEDTEQCRVHIAKRDEVVGMKSETVLVGTNLVQPTEGVSQVEPEEDQTSTDLCEDKEESRAVKTDSASLEPEPKNELPCRVEQKEGQAEELEAGEVWPRAELLLQGKPHHHHSPSTEPDEILEAAPEPHTDRAAPTCNEVSAVEDTQGKRCPRPAGESEESEEMMVAGHSQQHHPSLITVQLETKLVQREEPRNTVGAISMSATEAYLSTEESSLVPETMSFRENVLTHGAEVTGELKATALPCEEQKEYSGEVASPEVETHEAEPAAAADLSDVSPPQSRTDRALELKKIIVTSTMHLAHVMKETVEEIRVVTVPHVEGEDETTVHLMSGVKIMESTHLHASFGKKNEDVLQHLEEQHKTPTEALMDLEENDGKPRPASDHLKDQRCEEMDEEDQRDGLQLSSDPDQVGETSEADEEAPMLEDLANNVSMEGPCVETTTPESGTIQTAEKAALQVPELSVRVNEAQDFLDLSLSEAAPEDEAQIEKMEEPERQSASTETAVIFSPLVIVIQAIQETEDDLRRATGRQRAPEQVAKVDGSKQTSAKDDEDVWLDAEESILTEEEEAVSHVEEFVDADEEEGEEQGEVPDTFEIAPDHSAEVKESEADTLLETASDTEEFTAALDDPDVPTTTVATAD
ncbi:titin isoform X2 [Synchiropus splendidus]|uniref:titin isoform X2 n=1 Tax=Synchiropus splendidus TaxID=270530 RepID=UPI00237E836F|nr:titin isoform X2 [Synchiropus splendidus]